MTRAPVFFLFAALAAANAQAKPAMLREAAALTAKPGGGAALAQAPEGAIVDLERRGPRWSRVTFEGRRGYVTTALLDDAAAVVPAPPEAPAAGGATPYDPAANPGCDLGYPYSGSARYFTGLNELRHSGPLGFFLGYHVARPCGVDPAASP